MDGGVASEFGVQYFEVETRDTADKSSLFPRLGVLKNSSCIESPWVLSHSLLLFRLLIGRCCVMSAAKPVKLPQARFSAAPKVSIQITLNSQQNTRTVSTSDQILTKVSG